MNARSSVVAAALLAGCHIPASQSESPHHLTNAEIDAIPNAFPTTLARPRDPRYQPLAASLAQRNGVEGMGQLTSTLIDLTRVRVPVFVEECGKANAFYDPRSQQIHVCYEFIALINRLAEKPAAALDPDTKFVIAFTALHEMAHALIDLMNVRTDREEDRADQFALLAMTNVNDANLARDVVHASAAFFVELDEAEGGEHDDSDPHSASIRRAADAICLLYGRWHDPALGARLGERAARCEALTLDAVQTWNGWLAPYTRLDTGRTF